MTLETVSKVEPALKELFRLMQHRSGLKLKFRHEQSTYVISSVRRAYSELEQPSNYDFFVIGERRGIFYEFHWAQMLHFKFLVADYDFTADEVELLDKDHHRFPTAELRSQYFAEKAVQALKLYYDRTGGRDGLVFTLDGRLRNCDALVDAGVNPQQITVIEMNPVVALFQKLLAQHPARNVRVIYAENGFQQYFREHPQGDDDDDYVAAYMDYCGDVQAGTQDTLEAMPNLLVYGVTQAVRNTRGTIPELEDFEQIRKFDPDRVRCNFYGLGDAAEWTKGEMDQEHVMRQILDDGFDWRTNERIYLVKWRDGEESWVEQDCLLEDDVDEYLLDKTINSATSPVSRSL